MSEPCRNQARGRQGDPGLPSYVYFSYASNVAGAGFSLTPDPSLKYIQGIVLHAIPTSLTISDFPGAWVKYIGDDGAAGAPGAPGANGTNGTNGVDGINGAVSFEYVFLDNYAASNPGTGNFKLNNASVLLATEMYISSNIPTGTPIDAILSLMGVSSSGVKSRIQLSEEGQPNNFVVFDVTGIVDNGVWHTVTISYVGASATAPFVDLDRVIVSMSITGDKGDTGTTVLVNDVTPAGSAGAGTATIKTYTIPGGTMGTNQDGVNIRTVVQNMNTNASIADLESCEVVISQGAQSWRIGNYLFNWATDSFIVEANISRISSTTGLISYKQTGAGIPSPVYISVEPISAVDFTLGFDVDIITTESIVGGAQPEYIIARQLFAEKIAI